MKHRLVFLLAVGAAFSPLTRGADVVTYSFECDTPASHWSDWTRTVTGPAIHATGKITVNEVRSDDQWMPSASVQIRGTQNGKAAVAGVGLTGSKHTPDRIYISIYLSGEPEPLNLGAVPSTTTEFVFNLRLDAKGLLSVSLGGQTGSHQLKNFKPEKLALACSTGDFEFTATKIDSGK